MTTGAALPEAAAPWGRFDDVVAGTGVRFRAPHRVLVATAPAEVGPVLAEVDRATRQGCWAFGYLAYEAAAGLDPGLASHHPLSEGAPLVWFGLSDEPDRLPAVAPDSGQVPRYTVGPWQRDWTPERYRRDVARIRDHIAAGDTYQCNYTVRLRSTVHGDLPRLYTDLALNQRARYAAYLDLGTHAVVSASPELFFEWAGDRLVTRPMKGTAARGRTVAEDRARLQGLVTSSKERAENVMIVDLLRNDVSRVADTGTVGVPALCTPERYETVWQLTSDVTGTVPADTALLDVFRALFPSGSVTGAPKRRTMEIIRGLEGAPRGVYCGAIGMVGPPSARFRARFSVAIRTIVVDRASGSAVYGAGGGITWASDADAELAEVHAKTAVLAAPHRDFDLLETLAHISGVGPRHLERHLDRLESSAEYFGFPFDRLRAEAEISQATEQAGHARLRLLLGRSGAFRVELSGPPRPSARAVTLAVDDEPIDSTQRWMYHKTTRREHYDDRARRHPEADDVVLVNESGQVTETTIANLAARLDGSWWTPPVEAGLLPGVERGRLLDVGALRERDLTPEDLSRADALAVVSSLRGWRPAVLRPGIGAGPARTASGTAVQPLR